MKTRLKNRQTMYLVVTGYCNQDEQQEAIAALPAFQRAYDKFKVYPQQIYAMGQLQQQRSAGQTKTKAKLREAMADAVARAASGVRAYADEKGDLELYEIVNVTPAKLKYGAAIDAVNWAERILKAATEHVADLADYGIDQAQLDAVDLAIDEFSAAIGKPREAIIERRSATQSLPELFAAADQHLARMDDLTDQLEGDFPEFVRDFRNTRVIVNRRGSHKGGGSEVEEVVDTELTQPVVLPNPVEVADAA